MVIGSVTCKFHCEWKVKVPCQLYLWQVASHLKASLPNQRSKVCGQPWVAMSAL